MKYIIACIKDFHKDYFSIKLFLWISLFISILISFNYALDFEHSYIKNSDNLILKYSLFFLLHALAFYGVLFIIKAFNRDKMQLDAAFWLKSIFGFLILALDRTSPFLLQIIPDTCPSLCWHFYYKLLSNSFSWLLVFLPLVALKFIFDSKEQDGIYGLRFKKVNVKVYFIMLLIMLPIILIASFLPDFIEYYPVYKRSGGANFALYYNIPQLWSKLIFEFFYLTDFLNTELFFRGFLVIGLSKMLGKNVVLPMAATYAVLHFGKPILETISSVFGGYILGIIALYTRNIWGGVFVHAGIAFLMEFFAFICIMQYF